MINFIFLFLLARLQFIPAESWGLVIMFIIVFYEGLLGGATYVNAYYRITKEVIRITFIRSLTPLYNFTS